MKIPAPYAFENRAPLRDKALTRMRPATALLFSTLFLTPACTNGSYDRTVGGMGVGAIAGAATGALCCGNPGRDIGPGLFIGAAVGALAGYLLDLAQHSN